jgi:glutathione peroxidase
LNVLPNLELERLNGNKEQTSDYADKVLLIVNVASQCGFTSQYKELQALYDEFHTQGLEILAFPCNQFGGQEPGSPEQIQAFCSARFGVTFPVFQKTDVNGANTHPLFAYLKTAAPGLLGTEAIKWNFTKFLVNRDGLPVKRFASASAPASIGADIKKLL